MDTRITIIAALGVGNEIGKNGSLLWHLKDDLKRFKEITTGHSVIVGRKTYESILHTLGKPLPNRKMVVISRNEIELPDGCVLVHSFEDALKEVGKEEVFVIGGAEIYTLALPYANKMCITRVASADTDADTFFPKWDEDEWKMKSQEGHPKDTNNDHTFVWEVWEKKKKLFVELQHSRSLEQTNVMERIAKRGECPFCIENLQKEHTLPIEEKKYWIVTENQYPYAQAKKHILIISKKHAERLEDLSLSAFKQLGTIVKELERLYMVESGALCMRFGNPQFNGGTVNHLHFHFIVPKKPEEGSEPLRFRISGKLKN